jgi:hypothetical protein
VLGETTAEVNNVEVLKNVQMGLLAGDPTIWSLVVIVTLGTLVVVDAAILGRRMSKKTVLEQDLVRKEHERSLREDIIHSDWFGNRWHSISDD